ncbi:MAG: GcrA family cell cycle regulator [Pseudomonadota bacterium]
MSWSEERVEALKAMWAEGRSASQIAKELGGVTRNAVIGKVHRLGLSNRAAGAAKPAAKEKTAKPAQEPEAMEPTTRTERTPPAAAEPVAAETPKPPVREPARKIPVPGQPLPPQPAQSEVSAETLENLVRFEKSAKKLSLLELTERTCKWPIGDPATDEFWFCGHPCAPGKPYCETHVAIAFQPMSSRRDRRPSSR